MKKWLIRCLTVLAMVCLIPGTVLNVKAAETVQRRCARCGSTETREILGYRKYDSNSHRVYVTECQNCHNDGNVSYLQVHTGGTETPTCTKGKTCEKCGAEYGEKDPNNHDLVHHDAKAPSCTEIGWDAYDTCSRCNYTTYAELPALKHYLVYYKAKDPTCTEPGCDAYETCSRCDHTTYVERPALKHDLRQRVIKAPTCTQMGWAYETCSRCDYSATPLLPVLNHDLKQHAAKAPTCTEKGWDTYDTCSRCDYTTRKELPALNHDYQAVTVEPTCEADGYTVFTCSRCDHTTYTELPALNHALEQHEAQAPTCTEIGWDAYETCSRCDYTTRKELPALNHALEQHEAKAPTCTEKGWSAYETCSRCDHTTYAELPALNHDLEQHDAKAPTCTEKGWDAYDTCSRCDYTTRKEIPALNHALEQHAAKAPTCTEPGWSAYETCSRCNYTTYHVRPALKHNLVQHAAKAPTCTEIGWDAYEGCTRSGCNYTTYHVRPALKHNLVQHAAKAPTCTEKGWNAYETCSRCDYTTYAELPALNHDYQAVTVAPTCETDGYTVFTCSRCKDSYTADPTDQLGHQFGAWSPNGTGSQSADCLRQGCAHIGSTDCRKFTFRTAEGEALTFCPVCGQAENAAQLEKIEAATAWANSGSLSAEDVTARTNGEYLSVAFETAGSLTQPTGRVRLALPAGLLEGKKLVRIAPDGTQTEMPFEAKNGKLIFTLDFANSELPVMLFRLVPQTAAL